MLGRYAYLQHIIAPVGQLVSRACRRSRRGRSALEPHRKRTRLNDTMAEHKSDRTADLKGFAERFQRTLHDLSMPCWSFSTNSDSGVPGVDVDGVRQELQKRPYNAEDKGHARKAVAAFTWQYGVKYPKAVKKITDDDELLAFFDFPAEHWIHLRTTNPIEPTFATVRLSTKMTKGTGSRAGGPWSPSRWIPPRPAGGPSTHPTSSPSFAPEPASSAATSSNAPRPSQHEQPQPTASCRP